MTYPLDFILLPIVRQPEHDEGIVPGLFVGIPPRRPARGRSDDRLFLRLTLGGNAIIDPQEQTYLLEKAAQVYFKTSGAVTGAIRKLAGFLNQEILNRNLHNAGHGLQTIGFLTVGVMRPEHLYLAQCGPTHAFLAGETVAEHLHDPELAGRGLGLARTTPVRYMQFTLQPGDLILLTAQPSPAWSAEFLQNRRLIGLETLRRDLISQVEIDPFALLIQARPGTGRLRIARPKPVAVVQDQLPPIDFEGTKDMDGEDSASPAQAAAVAGLAAAAISRPASTPPSEEKNAGPGAGEPSPAEEEKRPPTQLGQSGQPATETEIPALAEITPSQTTEEDTPAKVETAEVTPPLAGGEADASVSNEKAARSLPSIKLTPILLAGVRAVDRSLNGLGQGLRATMQRILPDDAFMNFPVSVMAFIAIAIPLIVVAVSWTVYTQRGAASVYDDYLAQAIQIATQAQGETDPNVLRQIFSDSLNALDRAEEEQVTDQSATLRQEVQGMYDQLEWIERLDFQPALVAGLDDSVVISRIVAVDEDLYLLNASEGRVIHATETTNGYLIDKAFLCGLGTNNGPLVDIAPLPRDNNLNASIVGIDANGNLLYCLPNEAPYAQPLPTPDSNWGHVQAMQIDADTLYVLDPLTNAVWYYPGQDSIFSERPGFFFDEDVPTLKDAVDMTVNLSDLYVLHDTSQVTTCVYSSVSTAPTRCDDPASFTDARPGRESGPQLQDAQFIEIQYSPPPEPSIYMLDPVSRAVYHFSVRLTLQRQYRSRNPLPAGEATAFTVTPNRRLFMALGNQVYYAVLP
jgi:hypothetical protein